MGIAVVLTIILALISSKVDFGKNSINEDYMSIEHTNAIKGIFVVFVILAHFQQYVQVTLDVLDYPFVFVREYLGQLIVTPFMFVSGYGILRAYEDKGYDYIRRFPKHRVLKTVLHFDIGVLLFLIANLILQHYYSPTEYITALTGWNSVGNSNWYIFAIICLYIITWASGQLTQVIKKDHNKVWLAIITTIGVFIYIAIISRFKEKVFYNTVICYPIGMWFGICEESIKKVGRKLSAWVIGIIVLCIVLIVAYLKSPIYSVKSIVFPLLIFTFTMRFCVSSRILSWLGKYTFSIYLLQRLPMLLFAKAELQSISVNLFLGVVLISTVLIAWGFEHVMHKLDSLLKL